MKRQLQQLKGRFSELASNVCKLLPTLSLKYSDLKTQQVQISSNAKLLEEENLRVQIQEKNNRHMIEQVEDTFCNLPERLEGPLMQARKNYSSELERRRRKYCFEVEDEVTNFIESSQLSSRISKPEQKYASHPPKQGVKSTKQALKHLWPLAVTNILTLRCSVG